MSETIFCYSCRVHHPASQMLSIQTARGIRWRCIRSFQAAQRSITERDAFGRRQSEINRAGVRRKAERLLIPFLERRHQR